MELYQVSAGSLDAWIAEHLQPSEEFQLQVKDTVRRICDFLKETCFDDIKVFKTVMVTPGSKPSPQVYEDLIQAGAGPGEFCTSFTELQRDFIKHCPAKLKNLLRLVKHWYKETTSGLPPKYALDLLTIYAWESGTKGAENFSTSEGFPMVMELLCRYQELCVYWTEFYDLQSSVIGPHVKQLLREPW
ncbi:2'-5'-oligoadenylate synthase 3-like isoform X2 [Chrysemys picta bellii]|uniref:2'-5'-oligoadenylate synthase 3-like isoform X2 n=1 Tax=Chrysemys picta bellii TaxID=8478 RepID=UPI0032B1BD43